MLHREALQSFLENAVAASLAAGDILKALWGKLNKINEKQRPGDLVTEADQASEKKIVEILQETYPSHSILAEESGLHAAQDHTFLWIIDPLDGTTNYAHQFPFVAVSIALLFQGYPVIGVVYNPILEELFTAAQGMGAFLNRQPLHVSKVNQLGSSLLATGFSYRRRETLDNNYQEFSRLTNLSQGVRRAGAASLDLAYVAAGRLDGYWENDLCAWDIAAGMLLVKEAGGIVTAYDGTPLNIMKPQILATNGLLHETISKELRDCTTRESIHANSTSQSTSNSIFGQSRQEGI